VKVQAVKNGKSMLSAASAQLAVACVFSHDATYDAGSVASSGRTGTSFNSDEKVNERLNITPKSNVAFLTCRSLRN
jgi:hypothetical protein